jgi:CheY-like chemotaxis protein
MRVVIVEDQVLLREGLARLFADGGHDVVTTLGDASTVVDVADRERPDLVVLDFRMPPTYTDEGTRAARDLKARCPDDGVLLLSQHIEATHAVDLVSRPGLRLPSEGPGARGGDFLESTGAGLGRVGGSSLEHRLASDSAHPVARRPLLPNPARHSAAHDQHPAHPTGATIIITSGRDGLPVSRVVNVRDGKSTSGS